MFELYLGSATDHFYTTNPAERDAARSLYGFAYQGIAFYVEGSPVPGTAGFQRFYQGGALTDHFYTTDPGEVAYVLANGWAAEGTEGYLYTGPVAGTVPLYRLHWYPGNGQLDHLYTPHYAFVQALQAGGWTLDGVAGYVWLSDVPPPPPPPPPATNDPLQVSIQGASVRIFNTVTRVEHLYSNVIPCGAGLASPEQYDLNGTPGFEIVIRSISCAQSLIAIDDANQRVYRWDVTVGSYRAFMFGETDASHGGKEIVFVSNPFLQSQGSTLTSIKLSATSTAVGRVSLGLLHPTAKFNGVLDYDGQPGDEIALVGGFGLFYFRDSGSGLSQLWSTTLGAVSATFYRGVDTDGRAGAEVVVPRTIFGGAPNVAIVDLARRQVRTYASGWTQVSSAIRDRDGFPGAEICYVAGGVWRTVVDRTQSIGPGTYCP
jgi:hypothetical protein